jgi:hypothetical protein
MDAKTRDEEASKNSGKKDSWTDSVRKKVTDALTPNFVKQINKALNPDKK